MAQSAREVMRTAANGSPFGKVLHSFVGGVNSGCAVSAAMHVIVCWRGATARHLRYVDLASSSSRQASGVADDGRSNGLV